MSDWDYREDVAPRADEALPAAGTDKPADQIDPCPEATEHLIPWLREQFPEIGPRTNDPDVVSACIARKGINDLIEFVALSLQKARDDQKED